MKKLLTILAALSTCAAAFGQLDTKDPTSLVPTAVDQKTYDTAVKASLPTQEMTALFPAFHLSNFDFGKERGVVLVLSKDTLRRYRDAYFNVLSAGALIKVDRYDPKGKLLEPLYREISADSLKTRSLAKVDNVLIPLGTDTAYGGKNETVKVDVTFLIRFTLEGHTPKQLTDKWQPVHFTLAPLAWAARKW